MALVAPSILSADFSKLGEAVTLLDEASVDYIHIDVMDGRYVPNLTFGPPVIQAIRPLTSIPFDVHLMIEEPENSVMDYIRAGVDRITFHTDATIHAHRLIYQIKEAGAKAGISLNPSQNPEAIRYILDDVDLVLLMSVNPGFGGQSFLPSTIAKAEYLRSMTERKNLEVMVDGGINETTGAAMVQAGCDSLVAGSYIFKHDDPKAAIEVLRRL